MGVCLPGGKRNAILFRRRCGGPGHSPGTVPTRATFPFGGPERPNAWGLYDMHGNVAEWCWDGYDTDYYQKSPGALPLDPSKAAKRLLRGRLAGAVTLATAGRLTGQPSPVNGTSPGASGSPEVNPSRPTRSGTPRAGRSLPSRLRSPELERIRWFRRNRSSTRSA